MSDKLLITCPQCGHEFPLDETLAGPMIAQVREESNRKLKDLEDVHRREREALASEKDEIAKKERQLADQRAALNAELARQLAEERTKIAAEEKARALAALQPEREAEQAKYKSLESQLLEAQRNELALRQEKEAIDKRAAGLDLEIARRVDEERKRIREDADKAAAEANHLRLAEKDKVIQQMQEKLDEAQRKGSQGSQQLQGDVLEVDFESALRQAFPQDTISPVKAGARGGDILQHVQGEMGRPVGTLFWEVKRTSAWSDAWVAKAKKDAADSRAEIAIIVSEQLPKEVRNFGPYDGVYVARPEFGVLVAVLLRPGVISTFEAGQRAQGKETKAERLYEYMMGPEFRAMLEGIALPFIEMQNDLASEKRATLSRWKRQEKRISRVLESVTGLQGDLQGIGGMEILELPGFEEEETEEGSA